MCMGFTIASWSFVVVYRGGREGWGWQGKGGLSRGKKGLICALRYGAQYYTLWLGEARWRSYKPRGIRRLWIRGFVWLEEVDDRLMVMPSRDAETWRLHLLNGPMMASKSLENIL